MKTYTLKLKGTKKNNTPDLTVTIKGENKGQAFNWAYKFFECAEFVKPYYATGLKKMCEGTAFFVPESENMMHLAGKYKVHRSSF
jgi:hypothetical protein